MLSDYNSAVKKLINCLHNKITGLKQQFLIIPSVGDICADLELALYRAIIDEGDVGIIKEKIHYYNTLYAQLEQYPSDIQLIEKILSPYRIKLLFSKTIDPIVINQQYNHSDSILPEDNESLTDNDIEQQNELNKKVDKDQLLASGYTNDEIDSYLSQGANLLFLRKLSNNEFQLSKEQSIDCMKTCITMGDKSTLAATSQQLIILLGNTGVGKSTVINYLHGCAMTKEEQRIIVSPESTQAEITLIGHARSSKTIFPQIMFSQSTDLIFCDSPGFEDNRGTEINIANCVNIKNVLKSANSVKILLLISYGSIFEKRGNTIAELKKTIYNLFGNTDNLQNISKSIIIGITKVPILIDNEPVTIQLLREELFKSSGELPLALKAQTHIIDPLDRRKPNYALSRNEWLDSIKQLTPIPKSTQIFQTALNATDKIFLLGICNTLTDKIIIGLQSGRFKDSIYYLTLLINLQVIGYPEIEKHIKYSLLSFLEYIAIEEERIIELPDQFSSKQAEKKLLEIKKLISNFQTNYPEIETEAVNNYKHFYQKKLEGKLREIVTLFEELKKQYYQPSEDIRLLSSAMVYTVTNLPPKFDQHNYMLAASAAFQTLPKLNENAFKLWNKINDFKKEYTGSKYITLFNDKMQYCVNELDNVFLNAKKIYEDYLYDKQSELKLYIYESINSIIDSISSHTDAKKFIPKLGLLSEDISYTKLIEFLADLSSEKIALAQIKLLSLSLAYLDKISKDSCDEKNINIQVRFVCVRLLDLKDNLEILQNKLEEKEQADKIKQMEFQRKLEIENQKLLERNNKLKEVEDLIRNQEEAWDKEVEREKQLALKAEEQLRKFAQISDEEALKDKRLQKQLQQKILSEAQDIFNSIILQSSMNNKIQKQLCLKQKRVDMLNKLKKISEFKQKLDITQSEYLNFQELSSLEGYEDEDIISNETSIPKLSNSEIKVIAEKELEEERTKEAAKQKSGKEKNIKELENRLGELVTLRKQGALNNNDFIQFLNELENKAFELRFTSYFQARGDFYYELAMKENNKTVKDKQYRNAIQDYRKAQYCDPELTNMSEQAKKVEEAWRSECLQFKGKLWLFTSNKLDPKKSIINRQDLAPEEQEELERIKSEIRQLAINNIKL